MFHSLLLEKTQNNSIYKENQILNLFLLMLNLQQDSRQKQTQQEEENCGVENCQLSLEYG